jgi:hypothetical protein
VPNIGKSASCWEQMQMVMTVGHPRNDVLHARLATGGDTSTNAEGSKGKGKESRGETTTIQIHLGESLRAFIIIGAFCSHLLFLLSPEGGKYTPPAYDPSFCFIVL